MKLDTSSRYVKVVTCLILQVLISLVPDIQGDDTNKTSLSSVQPATKPATTFPTAATSVSAVSDILTGPSITTPSANSTTVVRVMLIGRISDVNPDDVNYADVEAYFQPQITGLCNLNENDKRLGDITLYLSPRVNGTPSGRDTVRFSLKPGSNPPSDDVVKRIITLCSNNQVKLLLSQTGPEFPLGLPVVNWTDQGNCPQQSCKNGAWCNANNTGSLYCQAPIVCSSCEVTTKASKDNRNLGLLGLLVIPVAIAAAIIVAALYLCNERQKKLKEKELERTLQESGKGKVYQNTVGKSYATYFNKSIFDGQTEDEPSEHKSTIRL